MEAELQKWLGYKGTDYRDLDAAVLAELALIAQQHGKGAKEAAAALDKFLLVHRLGGGGSVTVEDVAAFRDKCPWRNKPQPLGTARASNLFNRVSLDDMAPTDLDPSAGSENADMSAAGAQQPSQRITPYMSKARPASTTQHHTPASGGKFAERQDAGSVLTSLNTHLEVPAEGEAMEVDGPLGAVALQRCAVEVLGNPLAAGVKYMVDRLEDKVAYLERRILAAEAAAEKALECEAHPTAIAAQHMTLFVGRVCCDTEGGRLNAQSLLLEGSQKTSQGARARLDVSHCPTNRLFPGQVVAMLGTNPSGHCIVASQLLPGAAAAPLPCTSLEQLATYATATGARGVLVVAAAGPFTSSEDLEYAPLGALLDYCAGAKPDVLLLVGPFVDEEHPLVRGGLLEETFDDIYASRVLGQISRFSKRVGGCTQVLLVPSTRDVHHHPVLPQPPLDELQAAAQSATALANPVTLRCNEAVVGVGAADWLMACIREEMPLSVAANERLTALAAHLPAQSSYFPIFPPPLGTPLDCSKAGAALDMPYAPDLLLLPSDLAPFAKLCPLHQLDRAAASAAQAALAAASGNAETAAAAATAPQSRAVCINPGRLTKGASGGTFAHIHILPLPKALDVARGALLETNAPVLHQLDERCRVEIKRIQGLVPVLVLQLLSAATFPKPLAQTAFDWVPSGNLGMKLNSSDDVA